MLFAAYSRSRDPLMGGEDLEMINENLVRLRDRLGDERFAASLRRENPAVVSAVAWHLRPKASSGVFPISSEVLKQAPKKTFELEAAIARQ